MPRRQSPLAGTATAVRRAGTVAITAVAAAPTVATAAAAAVTAAAWALRTVLFCPVHDGQSFRDHRVHVYGGGTIHAVFRGIRGPAGAALPAAHGVGAVAAAVVHMSGAAAVRRRRALRDQLARLRG